MPEDGADMVTLTGPICGAVVEAGGRSWTCVLAPHDPVVHRKEGKGGHGVPGQGWTSAGHGCVATDRIPTDVDASL